MGKPTEEEWKKMRTTGKNVLQVRKAEKERKAHEQRHAIATIPKGVPVFGGRIIVPHEYVARTLGLDEKKGKTSAKKAAKPKPKPKTKTSGSVKTGRGGTSPRPTTKAKPIAKTPSKRTVQKRKKPIKKKLVPLKGISYTRTTEWQATPGGSTMSHSSPGRAQKAKGRVSRKATIVRGRAKDKVGRGKRQDIRSVRKQKRQQIKKIRGR